MSWVYLIMAGCMEILGIITMKKFVASGCKLFLLGMALQFMISFSLLSLAMRGISMSVAYAVWTGIGAAGGVCVGILFFKEQKSVAKFFFLALIIFSCVSLKLLA